MPDTNLIEIPKRVPESSSSTGTGGYGSSGTKDAIPAGTAMAIVRGSTLPIEIDKLYPADRGNVSGCDRCSSLAGRRYRLSLAALIILSWQKRRSITSKTIDDLECYTEAQPKIGKDGLFDLTPKECAHDRHCPLWDELTLESNQHLLIAMRDSIPETSERFEDKEKRKVLKQLINTPKILMDRKQCRALGDAVFAFFCPEDAVILTTNISDHWPLAKAIGKRAVKP